MMDYRPTVLRARKNDGSLLYYSELKEEHKDLDLSCVSCDSDIIVKGGHMSQVRIHFSHTRGESCKEQKRVSEESLKHIHGKRAIVQWLHTLDDVSDIEIEATYPWGKPDILFKYSSEFCDPITVNIEVQCSSISADDVMERIENRSENDVYSLWVFGGDLGGSSYELDEVGDRLDFKTSHQGWLYKSSKTVYKGRVHFLDLTRPESECPINTMEVRTFGRRKLTDCPRIRSYSDGSIGAFYHYGDRVAIIQKEPQYRSAP